MQENNNRESVQLITKKKVSTKSKVYFILGLILIGIIVYGYYWYRQTNTLRLEAQAVADRAEKFDVLENAIKAERGRCENFIAQKEGDFGSFEYCKKFIDWASTLLIAQ